MAQKSESFRLKNPKFRKLISISSFREGSPINSNDNIKKTLKLKKKKKKTDHPTAIDQDRIAEAEEEISLGRILDWMHGPADNLQIIRRQESLPHGVGVNSRSERRRHRRRPARVARRREGEHVRDARHGQPIEIAYAFAHHRLYPKDLSFFFPI